MLDQANYPKTYTPQAQQLNFKALMNAFAYPGRIQNLHCQSPALEQVLSTLIDGEVNLADPEALLKDWPALKSSFAKDAAVEARVAEILASMKDEIPGTVKLIFQPNEEGSNDGRPSGAQAMIAGLVSRFLAAHPEAAIDLQVAEKTVDLVEERIDLSIRITNSLDPNLISRPLGLCRSVICAAPAYLDRHGRPAARASAARAARRSQALPHPAAHHDCGDADEADPPA